MNIKNSELELVKNHEQFKDVLRQCESLRWKKLQDYGIANNEFGNLSFLIRMIDKSDRIKRIFLLNKDPNFESVEDNLLDLINYAVMFLMNLKQKGGVTNGDERKK